MEATTALLEKVKTLAQAYFEETVAMRRHLHAHPELSFQEIETGKYVATRLGELGIEHQHGIAQNGVVGWVRGRRADAAAVALRADMDALPIVEANEVPYKSKREGVMHACGHDVHTASLLATARILHTLRDAFEGTVLLIFQPAEERLPGGAALMIQEGVLENPRPSVIFGQHVHPPMRAGRVGMKGGMYMASADELYVTVKGKGGHGAMPHECADTVLIAAHLVVALQQIVSRRANPTIPSVLTFGKITSTGGSTNIIPDEVRLLGTFRTMNEAWREEAHRLMKQLAEGIAESMGGVCAFEIMRGYPFLMNHEGMTAKARTFAETYLGKELVDELPIRMTAEDFAYYTHELPAVFYRLGTGNPERGITSSVHTPTFDVEERALEVGSGLMAWMAIAALSDLCAAD